jgi:phage major head subunit gpT-like protein
MSGGGLSSRAIIGIFYEVLEQAPPTWVSNVSMLINSDQESEIYKWLGMSPALREWISGRLAKGLRENGITIPNKKWEATLEIPVDWLRYDKTGQIRVRVGEMADRATSHYASLLTTLIIAGEATVCYDGQYFFDTDHAEGDSGTQSNSISYTAATDTTATVEEMQGAILTATQQVLSFKDDQGEPMNEMAKQFVVQVPLTYMPQSIAALGATVINQSSNILQAAGNLAGFQYQLSVNPRLTWTTKFALYRADGRAKPFIRQEEAPLQVDAIAEGSELEFNNDVHHYGLRCKHNVGYGYWQHACLVTFT